VFSRDFNDQPQQLQEVGYLNACVGLMLTLHIKDLSRGLHKERSPSENFTVFRLLVSVDFYRLITVFIKRSVAIHDENILLLMFLVVVCGGSPLMQAA